MKSLTRPALLLLALLLLPASPVQALDWVFRGDAWYAPGDGFTWRAVRTLDGKCGCYRWSYSKQYAAKPSQSSYVSSVGDTITIQNTYHFAQPAAAGGSSIYAYASAGYSDLNLAQLLAQYSRLASQSQEGAAQIAGQLGLLVNGATALESERGRVAQILATGEASARIAAAVQPPPDPDSLIHQEQTIIGGGGDGDGDRPTGGQQGELPALVTTHCAACHSRQGGTPSEAALAVFDLDRPLGPEDRLAAIAAMLTDDPAKRMPRGGEVDSQTLGLLIQAFSGP